MSIGDYFGYGVLNHTFRSDQILTEMVRPSGIFASLHTSDPALVSTPSSTELFGGSYSRDQVLFQEPTSNSLNEKIITIKNSNTVSFISLPSSTVTHLGFWNSSVGGVYIASVPIMTFDATPSSSFVFNTGDSVTMPVGSIVVRIK